MAHKYGLLVYDYIATHQSSFDVITVGDTYSYPISIADVVTDEDLKEKVIYDKWILFKIVEHSNWGVTQDNAINSAKTSWNSANPTNQIPVDLDLIYSFADRVNLFDNLEAQITNLRNAWP